MTTASPDDERPRPCRREVAALSLPRNPLARLEQSGRRRSPRPHGDPAACRDGVARAVQDRDPGSGPFVQHLTLWVGFLGAAIAARDGQLLALATVDVLPRGGVRRAAEVLSALVAAMVATLLARAAFDMAWVERRAGVGDRRARAGVGRPARAAGGVRADRAAHRVARRRRAGAVARRGERHRHRARCSRQFPQRARRPARRGRVSALVLLRDRCSAGRCSCCSAASHSSLLQGRRADRGDSGRDLPPRGVADAGRDPALHAHRLPARRGPRVVSGCCACSARCSAGCRAAPPSSCAVVCAFFTAFTGGSGVTILALGALLLPSPASRSRTARASRSACSPRCGSLGLLFPPALPLILYGIVAHDPDRGPVHRRHAAGIPAARRWSPAWGVREGIVTPRAAHAASAWREADRRAQRGEVGAAAAGDRARSRSSAASPRSSRPRRSRRSTRSSIQCFVLRDLTVRARPAARASISASCWSAACS